MEESIPVPYYQPISDSTINLVSFTPPGDILERKLYFCSESWINLLHSDVENLLSTFSTDYTKQFESNLQNPAVEVVNQPIESPFELFRRKWIELGWSRIHLLGVVDGSMRTDWAQSIIRSFLKQIKIDEKPLYQIGSMFALYTFYFSQARTLEKTHISINAATLDYMLTLPELLSSAVSPPFNLNGTTSSTASTPTTSILSTPNASTANFSYDLHQIIYSLLARDAFFLIPSESYLFPVVPSVSIRDGNEANLIATAKIVLGAEEEMNLIAKGNIGAVSRNDNTLSRDVDGPRSGDINVNETEQEYLSIEQEWREGSGWKGNLQEMQDKYVNERMKGFPISTSSSDSNSLASTTKQKRKRPPTTSSSTSDPSFQPIKLQALRSSTLHQAQNLTLAALKEAGVAAEAIVPKLAESFDSTDLNLFNLVGKSGVQDGKGLVAFDKSLEEFENEIGVGSSGVDTGKEKEQDAMNIG